jgi:Beta-propeller repeat
MNPKKSLFVASLVLAGVTQVFAQPNGPNYAWVRHLPDVDGAKVAAMDGLGHVYVAGTFSKTNTIGTNTLIPASTDTESVFLAKYDSAGNVLWARHAGDTGTREVDSPHVALAVDSAGNACLTSEFTRSNLVIGSFTLTNTLVTGGSDMYVAKFNSAGDVQWARKSQGNGSEYGSAVGVDGQGNCYVGGHYTYTTNIAFDGVPLFVTTANNGIFVVKYNSSGQVQWVRNGVNSSLNCYGMAVDDSGNCFITGKTAGNSDFGTTNLLSGVSFFLIKYASSGVIEWVCTDTTGTAEGHAVALGPDGSLCVVGRFTSRIGFVPGVTNLTTDSGTTDVFLAKWNANGVFQWAEGIFGTVPDANAVAVDGQGNCYITGDFGSDTLFGSVTVNGGANHDFYVAKYNTNGVFQWVQVGGGGGPDEGWGVVVDPFGYVYAALTMRYNGYFGPFNPTGPSGNMDDFVLAKLDSGQAPTPLTLDIALYAGLTIQGQVGGQVQVQCVNAVGDTNNWLPMATFPFTNSPYIFIDYDSPTQPKRFYRALQLP